MTERQTKKIFLGCLPSHTDTEELRTYFLEHCPDIHNLKVKYRSNGICAGYGHFLTNSTKTQLEALFSKNHYYKGRSLECRRYLNGKKLDQYMEQFVKRRIYVSKIPEGANDRELYDCFSEFGKVTRAYIANMSENIKSKIFGFVIMESEEETKVILDRRVTLKGENLVLKRAVCQRLNNKKEKNSSADEEEDKERKELKTLRKRKRGSKTCFEKYERHDRDELKSLLFKVDEEAQEDNLKRRFYHEVFGRKLRIKNHIISTFERIRGENLKFNKRSFQKGF